MPFPYISCVAKGPNTESIPDVSDQDEHYLLDSAKIKLASNCKSISNYKLTSN